MKFVRLEECNQKNGWIELSFYKDNQPVSDGAPKWGMTLLASGSMRFRWNENNSNRDRVLAEIAGRNIIPVAVEQNHTKLVFNINSPEEAKNLTGDGILSENKVLMPVITIADCVPVCLFDSETGAFGAVHSGWKGTGIAEEWLLLAKEKYGTKPENVCVAIGAHIHSCCYVVNQERSMYFSENFTPECVKKVAPGEELCAGAASSWDNGAGQLYRLSLLEANLSLLKNAGIKEENIVILDECTCCNNKFGSNRREMSLGNTFTVQGAFVRW